MPWVGIDSEVSRGTSVRLYLPRMMEPVSPSAPTWPEQARGRETVPGARLGETVLVVEDNEDVRRYGVAALKYLGYQVLEASDGPEALRLLDVPDRLRIDLLFTDMVLPGGMNGRALADRVQKLYPGLPVLFTTGYTRTAIFHHDRLDPHAQLLSKPYTLETLALKVRQLIDTAQASDMGLH